MGISGDEIRARRRALGLTQEQLAAASGVKRGYLAHLERGARNPSPEVQTRLEDALAAARITPVAVSGVSTRGEVSFASDAELPHTMRIRVYAGAFPEGAEVIVERGTVFAFGDRVLVAAPGKTTGFFGKLVDLEGPGRRGVELDGADDHIVAIVRDLAVIGRAVRVSQDL